MGRKRSRKRKHLPFYLALLILLGINGCAHLDQLEQKSALEKQLVQGQQLREEGKYDQALELYREIFQAHPQEPPGDLALKEMAVLYIHPGRSPKKIGESLEIWWKLLRGFPKSPYAEEARSWISILSEYQEVKGQVEKERIQLLQAKTQIEECKIKLLEESKTEPKSPTAELAARNLKWLAQKEFDRALEENQAVLARSAHRPPADEALYNLGFIYAHPENPKKDYPKATAYFNRLLKEFPKSPRVEEARAWLKNIELFERSKQIDLEIDIQRKKLRR